MIKLKVTQERYNETIDLVDSFDLAKVSISRAFEYLLAFVVDDNGEYVDTVTAKKMFSDARVKRAEIGDYWLDFIKKVNESFVPPPNAATSEEQS